METETKTFRPSTYQAGVFDFIVMGDGDGIVNAVAGSGKTTTLTEGARLLDEPALFLAFNKHITETLQSRLRGTSMVAKTIHSVGMGTLYRRLKGKPTVDERKYHKLVRTLVSETLVRDKGPLQQATVEALRDLVRMCMLTLTDPTDLLALEVLVGRYGIQVDPRVGLGDVLDAVPVVLALGEWAAADGDPFTGQHTIDYSDMLWLPHKWGLVPGQTSWVFIDEAQDLNAAQLDLALKCRAPGGRMLFVGDPNQAIYGFAGADVASFWTIQERTQARILPLSICYRCPTSHLDLAREIVPEIEARPDAPEGVVAYSPEADLPRVVKSGDLILCRKTAPLIRTCFQLIGRQVPAKVRGRDIGRQIADVVRSVASSDSYTFSFGWQQFGDALAEWQEAALKRLIQREGSEGQQAALLDRCEAVRVCFEQFGATSADDLCARIEALFTDEDAVVMLSTVHRAKGIENSRVLILEPWNLPLRWPNQQPWEAEQEHNLRYVALTRAKHLLIFLDNPEREAADAEKLARRERARDQARQGART